MESPSHEPHITLHGKKISKQVAESQYSKYDNRNKHRCNDCTKEKVIISAWRGSRKGFTEEEGANCS